MSMRSLIVSLGVIVGLSSCGAESTTPVGGGSTNTPTIEAPASLEAPQDVNGKVTFNIAASVDLTGVTPVYKWYFGDGTTEETYVPVVSHTYDSNDVYEAQVVISDANNVAASKTIALSVAVTSVAPDVVDSLNVSSSFSAPVSINNEVSFNLSNNVAITGNVVASYSWDLGDNTIVTTSVPTLTHTYTAEGVYAVSVTISDLNNSVSPVVTTSNVVVSSSNNAPVAKLTSVSTNFLDVDVSAVTSSDSDGNSLTYTWDFGDGTIITNGGALELHSYSAPGTYSISVVVSDGLLDSMASQTVTVTVDPDAQAPYLTLFEVAYNNFLSTNCSNCHYAGGPARDSSLFLGSSSTTIDIQTAEQGVIDLLALPSGMDDIFVNPVEGANGHDFAKLSESDAATWTDLITAMNAYHSADSNNAPVANIAPASVDGLTVTVDASASMDADGDNLTYIWDFEGVNRAGVNATHTFATGGDKTITLTVTDGNGGAGEASQIVTVIKPNSAPTPSFSFAPDMLTVAFDSSASSDEENDNFSYAWDFGDSGTSTLPNPSHTYSAYGTYTVSLTLTDAFGSSLPETKEIVVSQEVNMPPVASFTSTINGLSAILVSTSTDANEDALTYSWIYDNVEISTSALFTHTFEQSGAKSVELIVTDSRGASTSVINTVNLGNQAPVVGFGIDKNAGVVTFTNSTTDPESDNLTYAWDFGDAQTDTVESPVHSYSQSGSYTVTLTVSDGVNTESLQRDVTVTVATNTAPVANFTATKTGYTFSFDASSSYDLDNDDLTYTWDFAGVADSGVSASHTFAEGETYSVTLTVSDGVDSDTEIQLVSTKTSYTPDLANGESVYEQQCASCHEGDNPDQYGEGNSNLMISEIAINRYLDHQTNLFDVINDTMPKADPTNCSDQCAADVEAFMMTWERVHVEASCEPADEAGINYGPRQMRLLTSTEYVNTVKTLFDYDVDLALLPADDQVHFFSNHAKTPLNSARLDAFESLAKKIVSYSAANNFTNVAGFDEGFVDGVARRAFRRPLNSVEKAGYAALESTDINDAMQALLISPYFLFRSELGMTKEEFIDFNENADPVYKFVGEPQVITEMRVNGGVVDDGKLQIYQTGDITMNLTGRDLIIIRAKGQSTAGANSEWPLIKPMFDNTDVAGYTDLRAESESFKNYSILVEGKTGQHTFKISNNDQGNHPQASPYSRDAWIESVTVAAAEQVIFEVPDIEDGSYALTPYEMATFIAYTYTGNTPDDVLLEAANQGFPDDASIRTQIERLMATDAAKVHFGSFVDQWLLTDNVISTAKDADLYPAFTQEVRNAMAQEAREIFNDVMFNDSGFSALYDSNYTFVNSVLADFYGISSAAGTDFVKVTDNTRGGLLASGAFLSSLASPEESHLIKRAVRIRERVMCQHLPPFPTDVDLDTIREIQAQKVEDKRAENDGEIRQAHLDYINTDVDACKGCHEYIINPLGVALEDYDAVGLPRTVYASNGLSVDFTGFDETIEQHNAHLYGINDLYETTDGIALSGVKSLGQVLANEDVTRDCLQEMAFRFVMDTGPDQYDHADETKIVLADDELVNYACAMDSMGDAMNAQDNPKEAFINLGLSEIVRFRKEYNR